MIDATFLATVEQCYKAGDLQLCHFRLCFGMLTNHYASNDTPPWLMETGGSMPHSQELSNNSCPVPNQTSSLRSIPVLSSHLHLGIPESLFLVGLLKL